MKKNVSPALFNGLSIVIMVMLVLFFFSNSSFKNPQVEPGRISILVDKCPDGVLYAYRIPPTDTTNITSLSSAGVKYSFKIPLMDSTNDTVPPGAVMYSFRIPPTDTTNGALPPGAVTYSFRIPPTDTTNGLLPPAPDTHSYIIPVYQYPEIIDIYFNSSSSDVTHTEATLSAADNSMPMSASPEIYDEPMVSSGYTIYPARVTFNLNKAPKGNLLKISLPDASSLPDGKHILFLRIHEKK